MIKEELIKEISKKTGLEIPTTEVVVESFMKSVKEHLLKKETVHLRGFGNFKLKKRATKPARNIKENKMIMIPEHVIPSFKPSRKFREAVKQNSK